ncbi:hypothetical protein NOSIN_06815 [Nocardiopsis sinuspersici]|uniref:Uncharacterized protein n=1 Tax=Nocardiopsis sinuspersici TaxID=501010 RepID=A0A1V3BZ70_9ACTN|nr:hypothetical protein NOSIN_06815 [Nocardiopsis sinuspersici]
MEPPTDFTVRCSCEAENPEAAEEVVLEPMVGVIGPEDGVTVGTGPCDPWRPAHGFLCRR